RLGEPSPRRKNVHSFPRSRGRRRTLPTHQPPPKNPKNPSRPAPPNPPSSFDFFAHELTDRRRLSRTPNRRRGRPPPRGETLWARCVDRTQFPSKISANPGKKVTRTPDKGSWSSSRSPPIDPWVT